MIDPPNPAAFPADGDELCQKGMKLLDYFAAQAIPAVVKLYGQEYFESTIEDGDWSAVAGVAYRIAEAMLAERESLMP